MMKPNSVAVLNYLKEHNGEQMVAADIAEALGLEKRTVDGIVTAALCRKGLALRTPAEVEYEDTDKEGNTVTKTKTIKFISLTDEGMAFDPAAEEQAE